ncbi:MAG TPA: ABC transporter permease [Isosphaeraceae bacterium]|jgi:putative ABC transport system permease protein|nr:ABC transporter permease [Isosphaeraceae bacterium]
MRFTTIIVRNLVRRGVRTVLTVLGLAIGISAVVALIGIAWGFERSFLVIYETKGIDLIVVRAGVSERLTSNLDAKLGEQLKRVAGVKAIAATLTDVVSFEEANLASVLANGWEPGSILFRGIRVLKGRALQPGDDKAVMLGRVLALNLNKTAGDRLDIAGEPFQVVGIYESDSLFENGGLLVPLNVLQRMMGRQGQVTGFVVSAEGAPDRRAIEALKKRIESTLPKVAAVPARDFVEGDLQIRLANAMAWATSAVALVLGSVGMLNTMMMAVFERTREIGVLRALGWRRRRVLTLILGEALALGVAGAALGSALGYLGVMAIAATPTARGFITSDLPPSVIAVGFALGLTLSLLGGLYPALRGASLEPTEALRYE